MHCIVRPLANPRIRLDVSDCLVNALAREIGRRFGGNPVLNRLEAEAHLGALLRDDRRTPDDLLLSAADPFLARFDDRRDTFNLEMTDDIATSSDRSM